MQARPLPPFPHRTEAGFTLVVISALLLVLAASVALLLPNEAGDEAYRIAVTQRRMTMVENAIQNFSAYDNSHRLLPCPARYDRSYTATGFQASVTNCWKAATPGGCDATTKTYFGLLCTPGSTIVAGGVPVAALGLPEEAMLDGWGNKIVYVMDTQLANITPGTGTNVLPTAYASPFQIYSVNSTTPRDLRGNAMLNAGLQRVTGLLISSGPNQNGAITQYGTKQTCNANGYDVANCDFDTDMQQYTADAWHKEDGLFDDIVRPLLLEKKNCAPPVPCAYEPPSVSGPMKALPENCVPRAVFTATERLPLAPGSNRHGDSRAKTNAGTLYCCNGIWGSGTCSP